MIRIAVSPAASTSVIVACQRSAMLERRRPVMQDWAAYLSGDTSDKVVPITAGKKRP